MNDPLGFGGFMPSQPQPQQQKKKKGFWLDQLSTGGGMGGAMGGAALGASVGSIVPGVGTVIGGLAGGILGGAFGSGAGELTENFITDEEDKFKNVGKEALLGGVFSAPPVRLAKGVAQGGMALAKGGGSSVAKKSLEQALTEPGLLTRIGQGAGGAADNMAIKQFRLTPTQLTNFQKKFGEDAGQTIRRYGFSTADDVTAKGIEPLQEQFGQIITSIPGVTKQALKESFDSKIGKLVKSAASDNKALGKQLKSEADTVLKRYGDVIDANDLNQIRREFDSLVNYTQQQANPARYGVNKRMADAIRETLQKSDPSGQLKEVGMEISKLKQLADNVARQDNLGRGSSPLGLLNLVGAAGGGIVGGAPGAAGMYAATKVANSPAGRRAMMGGAEKIATAAGRSAQREVNPMSVGQVSTRLGAAGAARGAMNNGQPSSLEDALGGQFSLDDNSMNQNMIPATNTPTNMSTASNMGESYQNPQQMSSPYGRENLMYDIQRDPANAKSYIEYYQMLQEVFSPQTGGNLSNTAISAVSEFDNSLRNLDEVESLLNNNSGSFSPIKGRISSSNPFDTTAAEINQANLIAAQNIGRALEGGKLTDADIDRYRKALPQITDTPAVAKAKIDRLRNLISEQRDNYVGLQSRYGKGGESLTDILTGMGGY